MPCVEARKDGWRTVRFGDVVRNVDEHDERSAREGHRPRLVGLEHLDPGHCTFALAATIADGTSFSRVFRSGQVLFGKRRAYQRKIGVAEFDGICSGDILVFEPLERCATSGALAVHRPVASHSSSTRSERPPARCHLARSGRSWPRTSSRCRRRTSSSAIWRRSCGRRIEVNRARIALLGELDRLRHAIMSSVMAGQAGGARFTHPAGRAYREQRIRPAFPSWLRDSSDGNAGTVRTTISDRRGGINPAAVPRARLPVAILRSIACLKATSYYLDQVKMPAIAAVSDLPQADFIPAAFLIRFRFKLDSLSPRYLSHCSSGRSSETASSFRWREAARNPICLARPCCVLRSRTCHRCATTDCGNDGCTGDAPWGG